MKRILPIGFLCMLVWIASADAVSAYSKNRYSTLRLKKIAKQLQIQEKLDTLTTGIYPDFCQYQGHPVTVIVCNDEVEHIGYTVFSQQQRHSLPSPVYNFLERYALEMELPRNDTFTIAERMKMDQVTFTQGCLNTLPTLATDTTWQIAITHHDERAYTVEWNRDTCVVCSVFFPSNYELMHGSTLIENENRLRKAIENCKYVKQLPLQVSFKDLEKVESEQGYYYVLKNGFNQIPVMSNNRYYQVRTNQTTGKDSLSLLCSPEYPVESVANLFSSLELENDYEVEVKLLKYNFQNEQFRVPLKNLISFFLSEKCRPYFGLIHLDPQTKDLEAVLEMRNHEEAYEHVMKIRMDTSTLSERKGIIQVILTGYVLTHHIKDLYYDKTIVK